MEKQKVISVIRDITERKKGEMELKNTKTFLERAQEIAKIGYWEFDFNSGKVWASIEAIEMYGLSSDGLSIAFVQSAVLPEYRPLMDKKLKELIEEGKKYDVEFKIARANDGAILDIHSFAVYDKKGNKVFGVIQNISDRKKAEEALQQSEKSFRAMIEHSADSFVLLKPDGTIIYESENNTRFTGYSVSERIGKNALLLVHPVDMPCVQELFSSVAQKPGALV